MPHDTPEEHTFDARRRSEEGVPAPTAQLLASKEARGLAAEKLQPERVPNAGLCAKCRKHCDDRRTLNDQLYCPSCRTKVFTRGHRIAMVKKRWPVIVAVAIGMSLLVAFGGGAGGDDGPPCTTYYQAPGVC